MNTHKQPSQDYIKKINLEKDLWKAISEENQAKSVGGAQQSEAKQSIGAASTSTTGENLNSGRLAVIFI